MLTWLCLTERSSAGWAIEGEGSALSTLSGKNFTSQVICRRKKRFWQLLQAQGDLLVHCLGIIFTLNMYPHEQSEVNTKCYTLVIIMLIVMYLFSAKLLSGSAITLIINSHAYAQCFLCFLSSFKANSCFPLTPACKGVETMLPYILVQPDLEQTVVAALTCGKATQGKVSE